MNANIMTKKIEMTAVEATLAGKLGSMKFNELRELRNAFPGFEPTVVQTSRKKVDHMKGLNMKYIKDYVDTHPKNIKVGEEEVSVKDFLNELCGQDANGEEIAFANKASFPEIKMWFLDTYPEIENFTTQSRITSVISKSKENRAAQRKARKAA